MFPKSTGRRTEHKTIVHHMENKITVVWEEYTDIKEPEWDLFCEKTVLWVYPPQYREMLGDGYLLTLCEEKMRDGCEN